mmetsp:Transcript_68873/g.211220  ORF Transcript_68873/g.211220 Transcript_68873/m.211220 type:complete len:251 (-) Transcript_68873:62-814(-)
MEESPPALAVLAFAETLQRRLRLPRRPSCALGDLLRFPPWRDSAGGPGRSREWAADPMAWSWSLVGGADQGAAVCSDAVDARVATGVAPCPSISCSTCTTCTLPTQATEHALPSDLGVSRMTVAHPGEAILSWRRPPLGRARERSAPCQVRKGAALRLEEDVLGCEHQLQKLEENSHAQGQPASACDNMRESSFVLFDKLEQLAADLLECSCHRDVPGAMEMFEQVNGQLDRVGSLLQQFHVARTSGPGE